MPAQRPGTPQGQPLPAEVVELEYAGPRPAQLLGKDSRGAIVIHVNGQLPRRCFKSGMTDVEAQAAGTTLLEYEKRFYWAPRWTTWTAVIGFFVFMPLFIVGVVLYFVFRRKVSVRMSVRRDIWWRRTTANWVCGIVAIVTIAAGFMWAIQTELWFILVASVPVSLGLAVVAATYGRLIVVRKVVDEWAHLGGAGRRFLEEEHFDFQVP